MVFNCQGTVPAGPSGYNVTVSLTNPIEPQYFREASICGYKNDESQIPSLASITSADGSTTLVYNASDYEYLSIMIDAAWGASFPSSNISCTGGVSYVRITTMNDVLFNVVGDGTITIDSIDYGD